MIGGNVANFIWDDDKSKCDMDGNASMRGTGTHAGALCNMPCRFAQLAVFLSSLSDRHSCAS